MLVHEETVVCCGSSRRTVGAGGGLCPCWVSTAAGCGLHGDIYGPCRVALSHWPHFLGFLHFPPTCFFHHPIYLLLSPYIPSSCRVFHSVYMCLFLRFSFEPSLWPVLPLSPQPWGAGPSGPLLARQTLSKSTTAYFLILGFLQNVFS